MGANLGQGRAEAGRVSLPHIADPIRNRQVQLVLNTTYGQKALSDARSLCGAATMMQKLPYCTTMAAAQAIAALKAGGLEVRPLQGYFGKI